MIQNFPKCNSDTKALIQEIQRTSNKINNKTKTNQPNKEIIKKKPLDLHILNSN